MRTTMSIPLGAARWLIARVAPALLAVLALWIAACATSSVTLPPAGVTMAPPDPDPRVGLKPGRTDAGEASWNLRLVTNVPSPPPFSEETNSDLAFTGNYAIQGNYNGFQVWNISNPRQPVLEIGYVCPASQSDVSIFRNLLFVSGEGQGGRLDCGTQGVDEPVSPDRLRGIRIFDISDVRSPKYIHNVQTCRGSHTHTVVTDPDDPANVYIYVSGSSRVRSPEELPGCSGATPDEDPNSALFRIEVIRVPLANPERAAIVSSPRIFTGLGPPPAHAASNRQRDSGPTQCHDITVYPDVGLAGGACVGYGILLDIRDAANPVRLNAAGDPNFAMWHSATFSNDGSKVLFTDEWGGGSAPRCRAEDRMEWGANAIFTLSGSDMRFRSYYKMPAAQTELENCVAHNGSLIPVPGRDIKVQGWYQGGISIFDWTDPANPKEIAFFDRGPVNAEDRESAGSWSVYWYNGYMYSSEIARGLDVFELTPSPLLSQNEIDAARSVRLEYFNAQQQQKFVWPASFALSRAYIDQLARGDGLARDRLVVAARELNRAEGMSGDGRSAALTQLATRLEADAQGARDAVKVRLLATSVRDLAAVR